MYIYIVLLQEHVLTALYIQLKGHPVFHLKFHIPYYAWRPVVAGEGPRSKRNRKWTDLSFLTNGSSDLSKSANPVIYEAQISLYICGLTESTWTAYSFIDTYFDPDRELGDDEFSYETMMADPIADGDHDANQPIWDPREYFLMIIRIRVGQVLQEWQTLVREVDNCIRQYIDDHPSLSNSSTTANTQNEDVMETFKWTNRTLELLNKLLEHIACTNDVWLRFSAADGDINYFSSLEPVPSKTGEHMLGSLLEIREIFDELGSLERKLGFLVQRCEMYKNSAQFLQLQLTLESSRAAQRNGTAADLTILAVSPLAVVSALFAIPTNVVSFTRNPTSFVISIAVMTVGLQLLLFLARSHIRHCKWWKGFTGRAKQARLSPAEICRLITGCCTTSVFRKKSRRSDTMETLVEIIPMRELQSV
jgi:hypothetical protein